MQKDRSDFCRGDGLTDKHQRGDDSLRLPHRPHLLRQTPASQGQDWRRAVPSNTESWSGVTLRGPTMQQVATSIATFPYGQIHNTRHHQPPHPRPTTVPSTRVHARAGGLRTAV